jgi:hypothetical protein
MVEGSMLSPPCLPEAETHEAGGLGFYLSLLGQREHWEEQGQPPLTLTLARFLLLPGIGWHRLWVLPSQEPR